MAANKLIIDGVVEIDLTSDTVTADKLLSGYTAHDASGAAVTGSMTNVGSQTITISDKTAQTITKGYHDGTGTAKISDTEAAKITASNIRSGVSILGVTGSLEEGVDTSDATASASQILSGKTAYVNGSKLTGTCTYDADTSDATASAASIESGKTAYVNGSKVTGTLSFRTLTTSTSEPTSSDGSVGDIWIVTA